MLAKHALIVDDSQTARMVLKQQLNQFDVIVESATDGNHALEMLRNHQPDVIFLDHIMPGLDGFQVLQLLKDNHITRGIPVVMYTSQAATQYTREAKSLGAIGVIPKKVTDEQLVQMLDRAEIYQFKAMSEDHNAPKESANDGASQETNGPVALKEAVSPIAPARDSIAPLEKTKATPAASHSPERERRRGRSYEPRYESPAGNFFVTIVLAVLVLAQIYGFARDRQQQVIIQDLREQLQQQELVLLQAKEEAAIEQRRLADATWRQVQFLTDILVDELEQK